MITLILFMLGTSPSANLDISKYLKFTIICDILLLVLLGIYSLIDKYIDTL